MKSQFKLSHPLSAPESNLLGSMSGLHSQIVGRPFRTLRFLRYLSVRTPSFCAPRKNFQWGKNLMSMSSKMMYPASSSQSSMENKLQKYMALPIDLAHSVFPSLDSPIRTRERGRSTTYPRYTPFTHVIQTKKSRNRPSAGLYIDKRTVSRFARTHSVRDTGSRNSDLLLPSYGVSSRPNFHSQKNKRRSRDRT